MGMYVNVVIILFGGSEVGRDYTVRKDCINGVCPHSQ
jgi:hypothetical protein